MGRYIERRMRVERGDRHSRRYEGMRREPNGINENYRDYNRPTREYRDYGYEEPYRERPNYYGYDYSTGGVESEYHEKVKRLIDKLERHDKFKKSKQEIISQARQMGATFKDYNEDEFLAVYYMLMSDYKADMLNSPQIYEIMAKEWLEDDDVAYSGEDKLFAYIDYIIEGC